MLKDIVEILEPMSETQLIILTKRTEEVKIHNEIMRVYSELIASLYNLTYCGKCQKSTFLRLNPSTF